MLIINKCNFHKFSIAFTSRGIAACVSPIFLAIMTFSLMNYNRCKAPEMILLGFIYGIAATFLFILAVKQSFYFIDKDKNTVILKLAGIVNIRYKLRVNHICKAYVDKSDFGINLYGNDVVILVQGMAESFHLPIKNSREFINEIA